MKIPELLAPAGNIEKAKVAIEYGADAIYLAGNQFGMRAGAGNFDEEDLKYIIQYAHARGVMVYVTVNIIPHNNDLQGIPEYIEFLDSIGADAIIVADPGVVSIAQQVAPNLALHLSTQANTTNWRSAKFWADLGISRLVMAREINREDIELIRQKVDAEIEVFVHGSMCMAYSGRCLISHVMTGRDANRGQCTQSCRWRYAVVEQNRPGEYFPIEETKEGTYLFNSKDLCLIEYIPDLVRIGVDSLKIEGRMKSAFYVGTVVRAYRQALDAYQADPKNYQLDPVLLEEVDKVSHRPYYTGFFLDSQPGINLETSGYQQSYDFVGLVEEYNLETGEALVGVRNRLLLNSEIEVVQPKAENFTFTITKMINHKSEEYEELDAAHANYWVRIPMPPVKPYSMFRIKKVEE